MSAIGALAIMIRKIFDAFTFGERRAFLAAVALGVASALSLALFIFITSTNVAPARGGEYAEGFVGQPSFVNPVLAATEIDRGLVRLLFANLDTLAEKVDMDEQGRIFRVRLKENLTWSDGRKLTSDDVIFTVQKIQDTEHRSPLATSWQGVAVSRSSELELQFNLGAPYPSFAENLKALYPVPKHLFAEIPAANWRLSDYNLKPVGSGPYQFSAYEKQPDGFLRSYRLAANEHYAGEAPFISGFTATFFPNRKDLVAAFNSGSVDGMALADALALGDIKRPYRLFSFRIPSYYAVFFNQSQSVALKDPVVRKALNDAAFPVTEKILKEVFDGRARAVNGPVPPDVLPEMDSDVREVATSSVSALENAGWRLPSRATSSDAAGNSDVREKQLKSGKASLEFTLTVPDLPFLVRTAEELIAAWKPLGAKVTLAVVPLGEEMNQMIKNRSYQAILFGNVLNPPFDLYPFWSSNERFSPGRNLSLYSNKRVDTLLENIRKATDEEKRMHDVRDAASIISGDIPAIFLYSPDYLYLATKDLKGVSPALMNEPADRFLGAGLWYLKTARVWE
ncbi:MAG: hypothetical protein A2946_00920 [Candidatus Liptonbacteria bacterium RIFCSPLOWO2_01_FULL_53_13]|uniref:Solute-binding protein family 5 domain-containing protein n=1 Tax=Candidatus Liptonbacteria bacterium RIFCSPLOWO2_01_FULL_53_13 TaxID=1798651 RepID=A0A1G2CJ58_9BACT|nr:MAG: hypothetical protein A2946_00920 [Candidatus Liptonbacteria bacterium RIFCSPLOWO2_01_FULL_53_13]